MLYCIYTTWVHYPAPAHPGTPWVHHPGYPALLYTTLPGYPALGTLPCPATLPCVLPLLLGFLGFPGFLSPGYPAQGGGSQAPETLDRSRSS